MAERAVAILHPWFPQYRMAFFEKLIERAAQYNVDVRVFYGDAPPEWAMRGDAVEASYATRLPTRFVRIGGRSVSWKRLKPIDFGAFDLVVLEQAIRNIETYALLARPDTRDKVAFWGHGRSYTTQLAGPEERLKQWLTNRGRWFFAYTDGGARAVTASGFPPDRISVVRNCVDTESLRADLNALQEGEVADYRRSIGAEPGQLGLMLGGLDSSKRIEFLLESVYLIRRSVPDFRLLVVGDGADRPLIESAGQEHGVVYAGRKFGRGKALSLAACDMILNPGRVGLLAVDSLIAGRPIVTTSWPFHAPEFEYLEAGKTAFVSADEPADFAQQVVRLSRSPRELEAAQRRAHAEGSMFTTDEMVERFLGGMLQALG